MNMFTRQSLLALGLCVLFLNGCATPEEEYFLETETRANVYVAPEKLAIKKIAIMPFKATSELIGASVSDLFVTEMLKAGKYELVERSQMAQVLGESELSLAGLSAAKAAEVGTMMGADAMMIGTVDEYSTVTYRGYNYPVVGITARLIDCQNGKVVWSVDLAERSQDRMGTVPEQARIVVHQMMSALYQSWRQDN
jgi:curli biogenesis system outer membrane secretion channel CsgG